MEGKSGETGWEEMEKDMEAGKRGRQQKMMEGWEGEELSEHWYK